MAQYNPPPPGYPPPTNPGYPPPPTNPAYNTPPQPYHPPQPYNPPQAYTPPPPTHHTIVVQQPVVVRQGPTVRSQSDDFLRGFGKALDSVATDVAKGASSVAKEASSAVSTNPLTLLRPGYIVQLVSKVCGKSLRVVENGAADCAGSGGTACQFEVLGTSQSSHIKLRNVANPKLYLAITGGYFIGYGQGGTDCDFVPAATLDKYVTFESLQTPGSHIGVLPSGQLTSPAQTTKATDASHFAVRYIRTALH